MKKLTALLLLLPVLASADPGAATRYLMNEPASLFDLGMLRAELHLADGRNNMARLIRERYGPFLYFNIDTRYEYENDLLVVVLDLGVTRDQKPTCEGTLDMYTHDLKVLIPRWFTGFGHKSDDQPEDLIKRLKERTQIVCSTPTSAAYKMLLEDEFSWKGEIK